MYNKFVNKNYFSLISGMLILTSFIYLAWQEKQQHDYVLNKSWWTLSFSNPKNNSLDYVVENHSQQNAFHSEIYLEKQKISETDFNLTTNEHRSFPVNANELQDKKVTIVITTGEEKKEIYKIITNN